jgi:hypothetical protein
MTFISRDELLDLQPVVDEGKATVQTYRDPDPIVLRRRDSSGAFQTVATFTPISVDLADRMEQVGGANAGVVEVAQMGTFEIPDGINVRRDDRFSLGGVPCVVTLPEPPSDIFGYRKVHFRYLGGV